MTRISWIAAFIAGAGTGAAAIVACGDDSPADADAACSCPAAEPPLEGRIVQRQDMTEIAAGARATAGIGCPTGATLLGGSCRLTLPDPGIYLSEAGIANGALGYQCDWKSMSNQADTGIAVAICLVPAE